ncbi:MAG: hypothetical protein DCC65_04325 [Planctomycetota bacterium]|nr:MAG: hypothetical protein DCC65_04325 [Planctomycetota bacterium]
MSRKMWVVARREYRATVRTKAFVIAIFLVPIFMFGGIGVQALTRGRIDNDPKKIAVLDRSDRLFEFLAEAAAKRNAEDIKDDSGKLTDSPYVFERVPVEEQRIDAQRLEISDRIRSKELFAFIEVAPEVVDAEAKSSEPAIRYHSNQPTYDNITRWLSRVINDKVRSARLAAAGIDRAVVEKAMVPVSVDNLGLLERTATGEIKAAERVNRLQVFFVPLGIIMLMWMALMMTTQPILSGVIEEKMQKISEVLLGSIAPFDLMMGKLVGYVGVAITLVGIYMIGGWAVANYNDMSDVIPMHLAGWFIVFMALAIFMYGALFLAAGACCNDLKEAQNLVMPIWLLLLIPMFTLGTVLEHPTSGFATALSLFPPATPMVLMVRMSMAPGVPAWQIAAGILGTILTTLLFVWAAGRVFRIGLLMQGKPPKPTEIVKWVFQG